MKKNGEREMGESISGARLSLLVRCIGPSSYPQQAIKTDPLSPLLREGACHEERTAQI